jgi:hypothetical protein
MAEISPLRGLKLPIRPNSSLLVKSPKGRYRRRPNPLYASYTGKTKTESSPVHAFSPNTRKEPTTLSCFHTFEDGKWTYQSRARRYFSVINQEALIIKGTSPIRIKTAKDLDIEESLPSIKAAPFKPNRRFFPSPRRLSPRPQTSNFAPQLHLLPIHPPSDSDKDLSAWA